MKTKFLIVIIILSLFYFSCSRETIAIHVQYPLNEQRTYHGSIVVDTGAERYEMDVSQDRRVTMEDRVVYLTESILIEKAIIKSTDRTLELQEGDLKSVNESFFPYSQLKTPLTGEKSIFNGVDSSTYFNTSGLDIIAPILGSNQFVMRVGSTLKKEYNNHSAIHPGKSKVRTTLKRFTEGSVEMQVEIASSLLSEDGTLTKLITSASFILDRDIFWPVSMESETRINSEDGNQTVISYSLKSQ